MHTLAILTLVASSLVNASLLPTRANSAASATSSFITESDGQLVLNGSPYPYLALDAYWLATLVDEQDVIDVLSNVSSIGVSNVVVPAYNLVNENNVPSNDSEETWLQLLHPDGSITFNEGDTGFKRLDRLVKHAKANDIHIDFTLSNNFDPRALIANQSLDDLTDAFVNGFNTTRPRNFLRNDFGGADFISATLGSTAHDFYSNQTIINVFKTIAEDIIRRYKDETAIGSWTPIKDAGCGGSLPQTGTCDTTVISSWHNDITEFIQELDPNHLVIASTTGFECDQGSADCPKLFTPTTPPPPPPQVSPAPGARRSTRTKRQVQLERKEKTKKARAVERARSASAAEGVRIRGRWISFGNARRQSSNDVVSEVTDGSTGVDSVDLGNSAVGGLTSSYLPFEKRYFKNQNNSDVENIIDLGNSWIVRQADIRDQLRITKPVYLTMGVPLSNFTNYFVFANSSIQATAEDELQGILRRQSSANIIGVSSIARTAIWTSWFTTARLNGINLIAQGLGANGISAVPRTSYSNDNDSTSSSDDSDSTTSSPNDGYNIVANDDSDSGMQSVISNAANELQIRPA